MASELTESFGKSRNRLVYFCGIGILLCFFPITEDSSLFGITFHGLNAESANIIFTVIASVLFLELFIRMIEERVALIGEHANVFKRLTEHRIYTQQISDDLKRLLQQLKQHEKVQRKSNEEISDQIINASEEIKNAIDNAKMEYRPGNISSIVGQFRVWVEYFSGSLIFGLYLFFQLKGCCNA